jgi:hypothetical protein
MGSPAVPEWIAPFACPSPIGTFPLFSSTLSESASSLFVKTQPAFPIGNRELDRR